MPLAKNREFLTVGKVISNNYHKKFPSSNLLRVKWGWFTRDKVLKFYFVKNQNILYFYKKYFPQFREDLSSFKIPASSWRASSIILFLARLPSTTSLWSFWRSWVRVWRVFGIINIFLKMRKQKFKNHYIRGI